VAHAARAATARALVGGLGFASFSVFWSTLSFQLSRIGYGSATAGTFGVIGITGVFVAPLAARWASGGNPARINVLALLATAASFAVFYAGARSLLAIGIGVVLLDAGVQANQLTNQTVILGLAPELRSRVNALYMVGYFAGGALGTALASIAWSLGAWPAVCACGGILALLGMLPLVGEQLVPAAT
jgi:predicted MFS family arabinose efflux permease